MENNFFPKKQKKPIICNFVCVILYLSVRFYFDLIYFLSLLLNFADFNFAKVSSFVKIVFQVLFFLLFVLFPLYFPIFSILFFRSSILTFTSWPWCFCIKNHLKQTFSAYIWFQVIFQQKLNQDNYGNWWKRKWNIFFNR